MARRKARIPSATVRAAKVARTARLKSVIAVCECKCQIWSRFDDLEPMKPPRSSATAWDHGRIHENWRTPSGSALLDELLAKEGLRTNGVVTECYEKFLALNKRVLQVSSDWQLRREGGEEIPNDHSDAHYDDEVIDRLAQINERARACLDKMASCCARFGRYATRLDACVDRLRSGDRTAFTAPLAESYHTVWFELHQDLLLTLGLKREE